MYLGAKRRYINTLPFLSFRNEDDVGGRERVTRDEERVLRGG